MHPIRVIITPKDARDGWRTVRLRGPGGWMTVYHGPHLTAADTARALAKTLGVALEDQGE